MTPMRRTGTGSFADDGADGLAQAADDAVLLDGDDAAALAGSRQDDLSSMGLMVGMLMTRTFRP